MTTPEHTLVGIHTAIALNLNRRYGWAVILLSGLVSNLPDWDGLPMLVDMSRLESGHRVWGHNLLWIVISSLIISWAQFRYHWIEQLGARLKRFLPADVVLDTRNCFVPFLALFLICGFLQMIHLLCDMVVSGGNGLSDWPIKPFWPFSDASFVFPLIHWGDVGPTVILMMGAILLARFPERVRVQSVITLVALCAYLLVRGWSPGTLN